ncbi:hypothetical protein FK531_08565 [Rhodococcus spelaei]|uniref:Lipoprotein n=1 Tax=Rhodococcus spelaei TaxID=2546320 RepID=A0A541BMI1_9NOCA|nr:hypothetical protein [Rhodococcus spelaei]TQF73527.1 hypothetical protein FK531_08565 [Rhodococcus spelaei]
MSYRRIAFAVAGAAAVLAVTAGCAGDPAPTPAPSGSDHALPGTTSPGSTGTADVEGVTAAQAAKLCSDMQAQLQNWRTYTPTIGKGGLNTVVGTWAAQNGINMIDLIAHKSRIDAITQANCADVRQGAMYALEIPDLAAGLIGF